MQDAWDIMAVACGVAVIYKNKPFLFDRMNPFWAGTRVGERTRCLLAM
jgi:hypothetical protein